MPNCSVSQSSARQAAVPKGVSMRRSGAGTWAVAIGMDVLWHRSEEHTTELQSFRHLVCRLLLENKRIADKSKIIINQSHRKSTSLQSSPVGLLLSLRVALPS